jgi:Arc/MetJ-type ribon-helix-helix transcriptional regulator
MSSDMVETDMKRLRVFCTIRGDLETWIQEEVEKGTFRNRSHAIEASLMHMKASMKAS